MPPKVRRHTSKPKKSAAARPPVIAPPSVIGASSPGTDDGTATPDAFVSRAASPRCSGSTDDGDMFKSRAVSPDRAAGADAGVGFETRPASPDAFKSRAVSPRDDGAAGFETRPASPQRHRRSVEFESRPASPGSGAGGGDDFQSRAVSPVGDSGFDTRPASPLRAGEGPRPPAGPAPPVDSPPSTYTASSYEDNSFSSVSVGGRDSSLTLDPMRCSISVASSSGGDGGGGGRGEDEWSDSDDGTPHPAASPVGVWEEFKDDDGDVFYYNRQTGETQWDPPPELRASISSLKDDLRASIRMDYAASVLDLSDDDMFKSRAASPRVSLSLSLSRDDDVADGADEFQSRAVSPRSRQQPHRSREEAAEAAEAQLQDAMLEAALGGVQEAARDEGAEDREREAQMRREMEEARELLRRQQEEMKGMFRELEPEPEPAPAVVEEDTRTFSNAEALGILQRFYAEVDPPKADAAHLKRTTDAMINMNGGSSSRNWQLKFFKLQAKRYKVDPRHYTLEAVAARETAAARARYAAADPTSTSRAASRAEAAAMAVPPPPTSPPLALPTEGGGATLSVYVAAGSSANKDRGGGATTAADTKDSRDSSVRGQRRQHVMKVAVLPLSGTEKLSSIREAIVALAASGSDNPDGIIPTDFVFLADGVDRVTAKQEKKLTAEAIGGLGGGGGGDDDSGGGGNRHNAGGDGVIILPKDASQWTAAAAAAFDKSAGLQQQPIAALVADQDEEVHKKERQVARKHGDLLSNLDQRSRPVKYILGGVSGRTVAETEAYIGAELEGSVRGPVAVTVWENERRTILHHVLTGGVEGFSAKNLTKAERGQWSDIAGHPKASPHEEMGDDATATAAAEEAGDGSGGGGGGGGKDQGKDAGGPSGGPVEWELPDGWVWQGNWKVLSVRERDKRGTEPDKRGWQYSFNWGNEWYNAAAKDSHVRRRRWGRVRVPTEDVDVLQARNRERKKTAAQEIAQQRRDKQLANAEDVIDGTVRAALAAQGAMEAFAALQFKEAYMFKRGSLRKNWLKRWFVLHEGVLHYYAAEADIRKRKKGFFRYANMIVLDESCSCVDTEEVFRGQRCFELRTWDRVLPLYTEMEQDQEEWKAYLNFTVDGIKHILETAEPPMKRGALYKRGEWGKWTRRWFVVNGGSHPRLVYYPSPLHALENRAPIGEFDLRGARLSAEIGGLDAPKVEHFGGARSVETTELFDSVEKAAAEKLSTDGITLVQDVVQNFYDERDRRLTFTVSAKDRSFTLSAETQKDYDEWMATLQRFIKDPRVSSQITEEVAAPAADVSEAARTALSLPGMPYPSFEFERSSIVSVVITADTQSGDSVYPAPPKQRKQKQQGAPPPIGDAEHQGEGGDVQFFVTIEQFGVKWTVQRPFSSFSRLHNYLVNADPTLAATLQDFVPRTKPCSPPEHEQCAADVQRYFERALDGYKRIHQKEFARIVSPKGSSSSSSSSSSSGGKLCSMEGLLAVQRTAHAPLPPQARWCRVEVVADDCISVIKRAVALGSQAEIAQADHARRDPAGADDPEEAEGQALIIIRCLDMYIEAKRLLMPRLHDVEPEQQVELSQKLALWSRAIKRLKAQRPAYVQRSELHLQCSGPCFSCYETTEDRSIPAVSAVLPQDSTSPTGRRGPRMALSRGEPFEEWPIQRLELSRSYVRTQPGCFRRLELIDADGDTTSTSDSSGSGSAGSGTSSSTGGGGGRLKIGAETPQAFALWLSAFQTHCKGRLDHDTLQREFGIAGVDSGVTSLRASNASNVSAEPEPQPDTAAAGVQEDEQEEEVYTNLSARTPDHTWLAHPRRGSISVEIEASVSTPPAAASRGRRKRRLSTDEDYLQRLKQSFDIEDDDDDGGPGVPGGRRRGRIEGLRTHSISGSVSNSPPAPVHSDDVIVMDFGSHSLKAGRARDEFPVHVMRSVHPETNEPLVGPSSSTGGSASSSSLGLGPGQQQLGESWQVDWDGVDALWQRLFGQQLRIDPACHDFIVTEPPDANVNGKRELAERLLEDWNVPRLAMRAQAELGLLSYGRTTGLAVSCGDRLSIIPYVEGYVLREYSFEADYGGRDVTHAWQCAAAERYPIHDDRYLPILRKWKEAHSFCKPMAGSASTTASDDGYGAAGALPPPVVGAGGAAGGGAAAGAFSARLDTGLQVEFSDESWRACETLFSAQLFRSFDVVGLHGAIYHVINQCPIDQRARLYSGIELMGGTTCFDGLPQRLEQELKEKMAQEGNNHGSRVHVSAKRNRQFAPWMGGAGLAEMACEGGAAGGQELGWITLEEVEEEGYDRLLLGGTHSSDDEEEEEGYDSSSQFTDSL